MKLRKSLRPLTNFDLIEYADQLKVQSFRGVFMRDKLPKRILLHEVGIVNLDSSHNKGSHWVCYSKRDDVIHYFDSFGLDPPEEIIKYLKGYANTGDIKIELSTFQVQNFGTHHCGYYCLIVLKLLEKFDFKNIILQLE